MRRGVLHLLLAIISIYPLYIHHWLNLPGWKEWHKLDYTLFGRRGDSFFGCDCCSDSWNYEMKCWHGFKDCPRSRPNSAGTCNANGHFSCCSFDLFSTCPLKLKLHQTQREREREKQTPTQYQDSLILVLSGASQCCGFWLSSRPWSLHCCPRAENDWSLSSVSPCPSVWGSGTVSTLRSRSATPSSQASNIWQQRRTGEDEDVNDRWRDLPRDGWSVWAFEDTCDTVMH